MTMQDAPGGLSFEEALKRLETIVSSLEGGADSLPLDDSLRLYEEGVALVRLCADRLDGAEQKVRILRETASGDAEPEDFPSAAE